MYIGVILNRHVYVETVHVNANDEEVAKKKLTAYVEMKNTEFGSNGMWTGQFVNTDEITSITKLHYNPPAHQGGQDG